MTVKSVTKDPETLTMTISVELDATPERAWQLWADPRQLERWWGPPTYPATVVDHDFTTGGRGTYFMTSPEGEKFHGWWEVISADPPKKLELKDGFGDEAGRPNDSMPTTRMTMTLDAIDAARTLMTIESRFPSKEDMERLIEMGMEEGITEALGQIDAILAESASA